MLVEIEFIILAITLLVGVQCSKVAKPVEERVEKEQDRSKRESVFSSPIYFDSVPQQALQPAAVTPPITAAPVQQQQQQGLPILGALVSNVPGLNGISSTLTTLVPLGNLGNLGNLGGLGGLGNLGNLGGLGGLGGLGNLGGLNNLVGGSGGLGGLGNFPVLGGLLAGSQQPKCPVTQTLKCRCENILPLPGQTSSRTLDGLDILQQNIKFNLNGDKEMSASLSNGLLIYQRSSFEKLANNKMSNVIQGFYSLKIKDNKYLTIYYTINDMDYTVKADVTAEPPQNVLNTSTAAAA